MAEDMPTVELVEGAFYWVREGETWTVALLSAGYFYPAGCDYSVTPSAISGPITPPTNPGASNG